MIKLITQEEFEDDLETYIYNAMEYYNQYQKLSNKYAIINNDLVSLQIQYFKDKKNYNMSYFKDKKDTVNYKILDKKIVGFDYKGKK